MDEHGHDSGFDNSVFHYDDCTGPYCDCDERRYGSQSFHSGGGMSVFRTILCLIAGFVGAVFIFTELGIDVENVPLIVVIIVIVIIAAIFGAIGSSRR